MPYNWKPLVRACLSSTTTRWQTISDIQRWCKDRRGTGAKPSAPCVKARLIQFIADGDVIGMKGSAGAAYFKLREHFTNSGADRPSMPGHGRRSYALPDSQRAALSNCLRFNRQVEEAFRANEPLPIPFQESDTTGTIVRSGVRGNHAVDSGPIAPEDFTIPRFCTQVRNTSVNISALDRLRAKVSNILESLDRDYRGFVTPEDVETLINEVGSTLSNRLLELARARYQDEPSMVEDELMRREWWKGHDDPFLEDLVEEGS